MTSAGGKGWALRQANCVASLKAFPANSIDSVVTDPPYELGFMGKSWDASGIAYSVELWSEVLRVLKPGGHLLAFGGTRTYHRMTCAIEDAGFEIRDSLHWIYGTGFPKSLTSNTGMPPGQGTALKPAHEPIVMARKPLTGTVAANVTQWGTGGLNIDGCRIDATEKLVRPAIKRGDGSSLGRGLGAGTQVEPLGRWPANVLFDEDAAAELDAQSIAGGTHSAGKARDGSSAKVAESYNATSFHLPANNRNMRRPGDSGGASRFFYVAKPSRSERDRGCESLAPRSGGEATDREDGSAGTENPRAGAGRTGGAKNYHPTVKPIQVMRYLCRLVTPAGGIVLDPFTGSGTTGIAALEEGFRFMGCEQSAEYFEIAKCRIASVQINDSEDEA